MTYFETPYYFFGNQHPITITLVGCGGTGSLVLSRLARLHSILVDLDYPGLYIKAIDPDIVEETNVGRQIFTKYDIGMNKAKCLISKINMAFNVVWEAYDTSFGDNELKVLSSNIILSCVDNIDTREEVRDFFYEENSKKDDYSKKHLWIDTGNGKDFGQVVLSDYDKKLPNIFDLHPDIHKNSKDENIQGHGCSVWESLQSQDLFINDDIALTVSHMLWEMMKDKKIDYHAVYTNLKTFSKSKSLIKNL